MNKVQGSHHLSVIRPLTSISISGFSNNTARREASLRYPSRPRCRAGFLYRKLWICQNAVQPKTQTYANIPSSLYRRRCQHKDKFSPTIARASQNIKRPIFPFPPISFFLSYPNYSPLASCYATLPILLCRYNHATVIYMPFSLTYPVVSTFAAFCTSLYPHRLLTHNARKCGRHSLTVSALYTHTPPPSPSQVL